jgi:hypothetical protein
VATAMDLCTWREVECILPILAPSLPMTDRLEDTGKGLSSRGSLRYSRDICVPCLLIIQHWLREGVWADMSHTRKYRMRRRGALKQRAVQAGRWDAAWTAQKTGLFAHVPVLLWSHHQAHIFELSQAPNSLISWHFFKGDRKSF